MTETGYVISLKRYLWHLLAGSRGGITRIRILLLLRDRPYNANQLHEKLEMDYKTIQHHVRMLMKWNIITTEEEKSYGSMYFLSPLLEENINLLDEILDKIGENDKNIREPR